MKRKLIYLFIAFAAAILPAHAQKFLNDELTLSNVSLWQQGNSLYVGFVGTKLESSGVKRVGESLVATNGGSSILFPGR